MRWLAQNSNAFMAQFRVLIQSHTLDDDPWKLQEMFSRRFLVGVENMGGKRFAASFQATSVVDTVVTLLMKLRDITYLQTFDGDTRYEYSNGCLKKNGEKFAHSFLR